MLGLGQKHEEIEQGILTVPISAVARLSSCFLPELDRIHKQVIRLTMNPNIQQSPFRLLWIIYVRVVQRIHFFPLYLFLHLYVSRAIDEVVQIVDII